jgi:hypothetical protein
MLMCALIQSERHAKHSQRVKCVDVRCHTSHLAPSALQSRKGCHAIAPNALHCRAERDATLSHQAHCRAERRMHGYPSKALPSEIVTRESQPRDRRTPLCKQPDELGCCQPRHQVIQPHVNRKRPVLPRQRRRRWWRWWDCAIAAVPARSHSTRVYQPNGEYLPASS